MSEEIKKSQDNELQDAFNVELRDGELKVFPTKVRSFRDPDPTKSLRVKCNDGDGKDYRSITCKEDDILRAEFELVDAEIQSNEKDILEDKKKIADINKSLNKANKQLEFHRAKSIHLENLRKRIESKASEAYEVKCFVEWRGNGEMSVVRHLVPKGEFPMTKVYESIAGNGWPATVGVCSEENIGECRKMILEKEYSRIQSKETALRDEYTRASQRIAEEKKKIEELM